MQVEKKLGTRKDIAYRILPELQKNKAGLLKNYHKLSIDFIKC